VEVACAVGAAIPQAIMITAFVAVMMIVVEYVNILTRGRLVTALRGPRLVQYAVAVVLGATPGCLGAFTVVALYSHRVVSVGAVVGTMIATSGDEAFVMLALFPRTALWLTLGLAAVGFAAGPLVDRIVGQQRFVPEPCGALTVHVEECVCFPRGRLLEQWRPPGVPRAVLAGSLLAFTGVVIAGWVGPSGWNWVRVSLVGVGLVGTFVVATVPDHFLREHLWQHVARRHVPRIFAWTAGVLVGVAILTRVAGFETLVQDNAWALLGISAAIGIIPESGPHLVFVTLYASGDIPISILVTSSIVQDGHGMLPLLAQSRRDFVRVKAASVVAGLLVGAVMLTLGF
jgi:Putative, 10TM heavy-metal exporter